MARQHDRPELEHGLGSLHRGVDGSQDGQDSRQVDDRIPVLFPILWKVQSVRHRASATAASRNTVHGNHTGTVHARPHRTGLQDVGRHRKSVLLLGTGYECGVRMLLLPELSEQDADMEHEHWYHRGL